MRSNLGLLCLLPLAAACGKPPPPPCADCCRSYEDCTSQACDVYELNGRGTHGRCVDEATLVYVNNQGGTCSGAHAGTRGDPVCGVSEGLALLGGARTALRLAPSGAGYGRLVLGAGRVVVYGPGGTGGQAVLGHDLNEDAVSVSGTADLTLDGVDLIRGRTGARCEGAGARLRLRRAQVLGAREVGLDVRGCQLVLDRALLRGNRDGALALGGRAVYAVTNSLIVANSSAGSAAVRFSDESTGRFRFNTVAGNVSPTPAGLNCGQVPRTVEDSILHGNTVPPGRGSQLFGACTLVNTVVGVGDSAPGGVRLDPSFVDPTPPAYDYRLTSARANDACCIDRGSPSPDIRADHFGTERPQRRGHDVGAHEVL